MKKSFALFLFALVALLAPSYGADAKSDKVNECITRVETCEAILREFMAKPETAIPPQVWAKARAVIISNQFKAGVVLGVQDGYAVLLVKKADGRWSVPALLKTGEASLGLQLGASTVETVYVVNDDETPRILFQKRLNVGVDAKAIAGPHAADSEQANRPMIEVPVLVYRKKIGLYAGATIKTGYLVRDDDANHTLYATNFGLPEICYSDWVKPEARPEVIPLMNYVESLANK